MRPLLAAVLVVAAALAVYSILIIPDQPPSSGGPGSSVGWLTFALIRPTIPAWIAAASC